MSEYVRHRFRANYDDWRPVAWPPPGPFWCSGYGDDYSIIIAYAAPGQDVREWWPEATEIDSEEPGPLVFSDRFPRPSWWEVDDDR